MKYIPGGDIFSADVECIINPVNCQAHKLKRGWQKGLAGAFEERFPDIQASFKDACRNGTMRPGSVQLFRVDRSSGKRGKEGDLLIANIATKDHWRDRSQMEWVDEGLRKLAGTMESRPIRSVAIPMLGAGLGGLPWKDVRQSIEKHFRPLSERGFEVLVLGEGPEAERGSGATAGRALIEEPEDTEFYAGIGARDTPESAIVKMRRIGEILAGKGLVLRSGGAVGADSAFEEGCDKAGGLKQIFLGWDGMNDRRPDGKSVFARDLRDGDPEVEIAKEHYERQPARSGGGGKTWENLGRGGKSLMARNTNQVLGPNVGVSKMSGLIVCWTKNGQIAGGTGQALRIAKNKGIPALNLGDPKVKGLGGEDLAGMALKMVEGAAFDAALEAAWAEKRSRRSQGCEL